MTDNSAIGPGWLQEQQQWGPDTRSKSYPTGDLRIAVAVSVIVHAVLIAVLLGLTQFRIQPAPTLEPAFIAIQLISSRDTTVASDTITEQTPASPGVELDRPPASVSVRLPASPPPGAPAINPPALRSPGQETAGAVAEIAPQFDPVEQALARPAAPTALAVRQLIQQQVDQTQAREWLLDCSARQARNELLDCSGSGPVDYSLLLDNAIYRAFNPNHSGANVFTAGALFEREAQRLRTELRAVNIGAIDGDSLFRELQLGFGPDVTSGSVRQQRLLNLIYSNDPAYQQMQRVMNPQ